MGNLVKGKCLLYIWKAGMRSEEDMDYLEKWMGQEGRGLEASQMIAYLGCKSTSEVRRMGGEQRGGSGYPNRGDFCLVG